MIERRKIAVIGSGQIGGNIAYIVGKDNLADVVLFDIAEGIPQGKALDITHSMVMFGSTSKVVGTNDYADISGSDVVIITASIPGRPKDDRSELLFGNARILDSVAEGVKKYCPNAFVICITNPLDVMVSHFQKVSGLPHNKVCGMAGVLDSSRFRTFIAQHFGVNASDVSANVIGGHGDGMVPVTSSVSVGGVPLSSFIKQGLITQEQIDEIVCHTRTAWKEVADNLKTGTAYFAPAAAAVKMAEAYLKDKKAVVPCSAFCSNHYGVKGIYMGVPTIIGKNGVEDILELDLTPLEQKLLGESINEVNTISKVLDNAPAAGA
ncbi:lactate/malate dehydrogenase alpha/beta C-terminal domain protein [Cryptosporidium meleagridis]|uniref:L-lactate dehydrogenase n=1 Tax=Cryptosporidium meleagridis TaxID=93969 RepID=A0A2P4Z2D0_9CRYT|nr:lactate/malate dehydrogenase alpha/beta C-terminal domain protein [Cryptosporidium meleagridis]